MMIILLGILLWCAWSNAIDGFQSYWNYPIPKMFVRSGYDSGTREYNNPIYALQVAQGLDTD